MATRCSFCEGSSRVAALARRAPSFFASPAAAVLVAALLSATAALGCTSRSTTGAETTAETRAKPQVEAPETVTVLSVADFHGALEPRVLTTATGEEVKVGGAGLLAAYVNRVRETAEGPVVLVDAGDMWQGSLVSNLQEGAPVVRFYNELGVAAAALGNHEFDFGPVGSDRVVPMSPDDDPRGALKERVREASFSILGVNVRTEAGEMPGWVEASTVVEEDGIRIGIVGGATRYTASTTVVANVKDLEFLPLSGPVEEEARRLREDGADMVVAVVHAGGACRDNTDPDDLSSCRDGELFELVRSLPKGLVQVFAGGHSHAGIAKRLEGAAVIQPFSRGQYLGMATVWLDGSRPPEVVPPIHLCGAVVEGPDGATCHPRHVAASEGPVLPATFLGAKMVPDERVTALLADDMARAETLKERPLGVEAEAPIGRSYDSESALGNLVADLMLASVDTADAAMINGGGLRATLPEGKLTYGDLFNALPFDNRLALLEVDGATLRRLVEHGHAGGHSALSWSGLRFSAAGCEVTSIRVGDAPLDEARRYRVATNSYLAGGGSGFRRLELGEDEARILWDMPMVRDLIAEGLAEMEGPLTPGDFFDPESPRQTIEGACE